jgi:hypothetical protein
MESNVYSIEEGPVAVQPVGLDRLEAALQDLTAHDLHTLPDGVAAARVLALRPMVDRLEGHWLHELAGVDGRGAGGAEYGGLVVCTASWLRRQLRLSKAAAHQAVQTARALYRGPLAGTATALAAGELSAAHAAVLAAGTAELPAATTVEAEPVLLEAARRLDPRRLRRVVAHLRYVADPDAADTEAQTPIRPARAVAGAHLGRHGRPRRAPGPRGRPDPAGRPGTPGPPGRCRG